MENGDKGQVAKKTEDGLKTGDELAYTLDKSSRSVQLKEPRLNKSGTSNRNWNAPYDTAVIALTRAKDIMVANLAASGKTLTMDSVLCKKMTDFANHLHDWLEDKR